MNIWQVLLVILATLLVLAICLAAVGSRSSVRWIVVKPEERYTYLQRAMRVALEMHGANSPQSIFGLGVEDYGPLAGLMTQYFEVHHIRMTASYIDAEVLIAEMRMPKSLAEALQDNMGGGFGPMGAVPRKTPATTTTPPNNAGDAGNIQ
jgi:hypothetical protein